jgi:VIT1/CCC1 family predicted Fe2+/Mn2+ transporter
VEVTGTAQKLKEIEKYYRQELAMAYAYRKYAESTRNVELAELLKRIAAEEKGHAEVWRSELEKAGAPIKEKVSFYFRLKTQFSSLSWRILGAGALRASLHRAEKDELERYNELRRKGEFVDAVSKLAVAEEGHISLVGVENSEDSRERGSLRNFIFSINDGFVSELALLSGVSGATSNGSLLILAGVALLVAEAVAMGTGAYLSSKSQKETYEDKLRQEGERTKLSPDYKMQKLMEYYAQRGLSLEEAKKVAKRVASDEKMVSKTLVEDELGLLGALTERPVREGLNSTFAFVIGGFTPLAPYLVLPVHIALPVSIALTVAALFITGASRTIFTGKKWWRSGIEMAAIGVAAAVVDYLIGGRFRVS